MYDELKRYKNNICVYYNRFFYNGVIDDSMKFVEKIQLLDVELWERFVQQFREDADFDAGWRGEYWGKMMRGACFVYSYTKNEKLYKKLGMSIGMAIVIILM